MLKNYKAKKNIKSIIKIFNFRFCKRHSDYLSPDYSIGAKLPEHLEERSNRFKVVLQQLIKEKYFGPSEIGCMDELPLNLSPGKQKQTIEW